MDTKKWSKAIIVRAHFSEKYLRVFQNLVVKIIKLNSNEKAAFLIFLSIFFFFNFEQVYATIICLHFW